MIATLVFLNLNSVIVPDSHGRPYNALIVFAEWRMNEEGLAGGCRAHWPLRENDELTYAGRMLMRNRGVRAESFSSG
jgi:hypothetical protein